MLFSLTITNEYPESGQPALTGETTEWRQGWSPTPQPPYPRRFMRTAA